jgi:ABC-type uncharacterized transport system ATPase subunit
VLELRSLRKAFGEVVALDGATLTARPGRITRFSFQPPTLSDLFRKAVGR